MASNERFKSEWFSTTLVHFNSTFRTICFIFPTQASVVFMHEQPDPNKTTSVISRPTTAHGLYCFKFVWTSSAASRCALIKPFVEQGPASTSHLFSVSYISSTNSWWIFHVITCMNGWIAPHTRVRNFTQKWSMERFQPLCVCLQRGSFSQGLVGLSIVVISFYGFFSCNKAGIHTLNNRWE